MEPIELDPTLKSSDHLPHTANSLKFAASRSIEIAAMTESITRPSKTKLIFQNLPVHMRRRVMSHNCKRLPRHLRTGHLEQFKKSGLPPKQKRPSRKYRRRPKNLLEEYNRRQRRNIWLETHIWHAKRFHMVERWGHRLAYRPCDKAFRACYRASSAHCLLQDISYYTPIKISGSVDLILDLFSFVTDSRCGLSVGAKAYLNGNREGKINLFMPNSYPFGFIGKVEYIWVHTVQETKELWLFLHPSQVKEVEKILTDLTNKSTGDNLNIDNNIDSAKKRRKITTKYSDIKIKAMTGMVNRFRLTGPRSHAVLTETLKCVQDIEGVKQNDWIAHATKANTRLYLKEKHDYWTCLNSVSSPSQLPAGIVVGLIVCDPRWSRPSKRTKAQINSDSPVELDKLINIPSFCSLSPVWDPAICDIIKDKKVTNAQFIEHVTKNQLVPGEVFIEDPALQCIPVVLVQKPGSQNSVFKKIGYGSGWDIITPSGYGLPFWLSLIMFGARSGGLREAESLAFEMGECYFPPDSEAGQLEERRIELELKEKYFKRPPSKRVNFVKYAVPSPFLCPWNVLLNDWGNNDGGKIFVLRDKNILANLEDCLNRKKKIYEIDNCDQCLVPVYLQLLGKGNLAKHAMLCLPQTEDICSKGNLMEPHHQDPNSELRKQIREEHRKFLRQLRKKRLKLRKTKVHVTVKKHNQEPSEYVKKMRQLWLPPDVASVRRVGMREVMGYLTQAGFSFSQARNCGVGYIAYNALVKLVDLGLNKILVRNTTSRVYRLANIQIIKSP